jgi:hypothetical protein
MCARDNRVNDDKLNRVTGPAGHLLPVASATTTASFCYLSYNLLDADASDTPALPHTLRRQLIVHAMPIKIIGVRLFSGQN